jgi:hypothetical protein
MRLHYNGLGIRLLVPARIGRYVWLEYLAVCHLDHTPAHIETPLELLEKALTRHEFLIFSIGDRGRAPNIPLNSCQFKAETERDNSILVSSLKERRAEADMTDGFLSFGTLKQSWCDEERRNNRDGGGLYTPFHR